MITYSLHEMVLAKDFVYRLSGPNEIGRFAREKVVAESKEQLPHA